MSFLPAIPVTGVGGLRFLDRTYDLQRAAFDAGGVISRDVEAFRARIGTVTSAAELVADRQLLSVALGAFGLEDELPKRAFLRKVLEEGTVAEGAFATRLADDRFRRFSAAFGFGDPGGARTADPGFAERITDRFRERRFEVAVGRVNEPLRLALNFRREIAELATGPNADRVGWLQVMGRPPLREVFSVAFGLPESFAQLPLERQEDTLSRRLSSIVGGNGSLSALGDPAGVEQVLNRFLAVSEAQNGPSATVPGFAALQLLTGGLGPRGSAGLLLSLTRPGG